MPLRWLQGISSPEVSDTSFLVSSSCSWWEACKDRTNHHVTQQVTKKTSYRNSTCLFWTAGGLSFLPWQSCWTFNPAFNEGCPVVSQQPWSTCTHPHHLFLFLSGHRVKSCILRPCALERSLLAPISFSYQPGWIRERMGPGDSIPSSLMP